MELEVALDPIDICGYLHTTSFASRALLGDAVREFDLRLGSRLREAVGDSIPCAVEVAALATRLVVAPPEAKSLI